DLVSISLPNLRDTEGQLSVGRIEDILEVDEYALRRFRPQVGDVFFALDGTDCRFEHQIERAWFRQVVHAAFGTFFIRLHLIGAKTLFAFAAIDERIGE